MGVGELIADGGTGQPPCRVHEVISLAKVQVRPLSDGLAFELWSMAQIWRYAAPTVEARSLWVVQLQAQVRCLLASFKQRGKSLAFLPQNVAALRAKGRELFEEKQAHERQVLELTNQLCSLDETAHHDRARLHQLLRAGRRSSQPSLEPSGAALSRGGFRRRRPPVGSG